MTPLSRILSIGLLSLGGAACGDYDEKNAAYESNNAAYDADNAAYDAGNESYDAGNAAYPPTDGNAGYTPPADGNVTGNDMIGTPPADTPPPANRY